MKITAVNKINKDGHAKKKAEIDARLLTEWMLCTPSVMFHQIDKNSMEEVILMRNLFYDRTKNV